ncbi:MAG: hypothetical protein JSU85_05120, partial [Candidatus Zixiibacteriota bacterium]
MSDLIINGNCYIQGQQFVEITTNYQVQDNIITVNKGEIGAGVTAGRAGFDVDRGSLNPYVLQFRESDKLFVAGELFYTLNYGTLSDLFAFGNTVVGSTSNAIGRIITDNGSNTMTLLLVSSTNFASGETITEQETGETAITTSAGIVTDLTKILALIQSGPTDRAVNFWDDTGKEIKTDPNMIYDANGTLVLKNGTGNNQLTLKYDDSNYMSLKSDSSGNAVLSSTNNRANLPPVYTDSINIGAFTILTAFNGFQVKKGATVLFGVDTTNDFWVGNVNSTGFPFTVHAQTSNLRQTAAIIDNQNVVLRLQCGGSNRTSYLYFTDSGSQTPNFRLGFRKDNNTLSFQNLEFGYPMYFKEDKVGINTK